MYAQLIQTYSSVCRRPLLLIFKKTVPPETLGRHSAGNEVIHFIFNWWADTRPWVRPVFVIGETTNTLSITI